MKRPTGGESPSPAEKPRILFFICINGSFLIYCKRQAEKIPLTKISFDKTNDQR
jgi:hypothetical protein